MMPQISRLHTGPRMSKINKHNGVVYLAGLVGEQNQSLEDQTKDILNQIDSLLAEAGSSKENMLRVEIWLSDMADFAAMNAIYDGWIPKGQQPGRACGESKLATPGFKVEFIVTAAYA
jgi:enamine deaminase RidA (YjgF/YER057c/UK114 family)